MSWKETLSFAGSESEIKGATTNTEESNLLEESTQSTIVEFEAYILREQHESEIK